MCGVQFLRVSVHGRISAAAEDFLREVEQRQHAAPVAELRALLTERLTVAAEEIVAVLEQTVAENEAKAERWERERRLLDGALKPRVRLHRVDFQQQHIKEDPEQWSAHTRFISQEEGRQLQGSEEPQSSPPNQCDTSENPVNCGETEAAAGSGQHSQPDDKMESVMEDETDQRSTICPFCEKRFTEDERLQEHLLVHIRGEPVIGKDLSKHTSARGQFIEKPHSCPEGLSKKIDLKTHTVVHTGGKPLRPFGCPDCGKTFRRKCHLQDHSVVHTSERPLHCSQCGQRFKHSRGLRKHMWQFHRWHADESRVNCGETEAGTNSGRDQRLPEKPYGCTECDKKYAAKHQLKEHMFSHTGERPFNCTLCDKNYNSRSTLRKHMLIHAGEEPFRCTECDKRYTSKANFEEHLLSHTGEKPFPCTECDRKYISKSSLKKHMLVHRGEEPFCCTECDRKFISKSHLKKHMLIHTEKQFSCPQCGKRFRLNRERNLHLRMHKGLRQFKCSICGTEFTRRRDVDRHKRSFHTEENLVVSQGGGSPEQQQQQQQSPHVDQDGSECKGH